MLHLYKSAPSNIKHLQGVQFCRCNMHATYDRGLFTSSPCPSRTQVPAFSESIPHRPSRARRAADRRAPATPAPARTLACRHIAPAALRMGPARLSPTRLDSSINLLRSRLRRSSMMWSATRAGLMPSMIRPMTPMLQRAAYHCASTVRKAYPGNSGGRTSILRPWEMRRSRNRGKYV